MKATPKSLHARRNSDLEMDTQTSFDVFVGSESFLLASMRNGGVGTISATANVNPAAIHKLYKQWNTADDADNADRQQSKLNVVHQVFSSRKFPSMIAALKQAIAIYADDPAWRTVRPRLVELTPEQAKTLAAELNAIGFLPFLLLPSSFGNSPHSRHSESGGRCQKSARRGQIQPKSLSNSLWVPIQIHSMISPSR